MDKRLVSGGSMSLSATSVQGSGMTAGEWSMLLEINIRSCRPL